VCVCGGGGEGGRWYLWKWAIIDGGEAVLLGWEPDTELFHNRRKGLLVPVAGQGHRQLPRWGWGEGVIDPRLDCQTNILQLNFRSIRVLRVHNRVLEDIDHVS